MCGKDSSAYGKDSNAKYGKDSSAYGKDCLLQRLHHLWQRPSLACVAIKDSSAYGKDSIVYGKDSIAYGKDSIAYGKDFSNF